MRYRTSYRILNHREIGPSRLEKDGQQYGLACWVNIYHVLNEKVNSNLLTPFTYLILTKNVNMISYIGFVALWTLLCKTLGFIPLGSVKQSANFPNKLIRMECNILTTTIILFKL